MNLRRLTILLIAIAFVFISQGCLPPPPPPWSSRTYDDDPQGRHRHWSSLEQPAQPVTQLANPKGEEFSYQREVIH